MCLFFQTENDTGRGVLEIEGQIPVLMHVINENQQHGVRVGKDAFYQLGGLG